MISFTGSTRAGRRISEVASPSIKRVALELGGKSPSVVLDDADLETAIKTTFNGCYLNSGQTCTALTRLLVPASKLEEAERIANDTIYGLMAAVMSSDAERAKRVAKRIRAGQVQINSGGFNPNAPFGGYKQSGKGREAGKYGLEEFLEIKALLN